MEEQGKKRDPSKEEMRRCNKYIKKRRVNFIKKGLLDYIGKNFVINYQPRYKFEEEWEENDIVEEERV